LKAGERTKSKIVTSECAFDQRNTRWKQFKVWTEFL